MDFFPAQRPGSSLCPRDAQSVHGDRLEVPISVGRRPLRPPALQRLLGAAPAVIGPRIKVVTDLDRGSDNEEDEPAARRRSQEAAVEPRGVDRATLRRSSSSRPRPHRIVDSIP
jgi:hypothetical protein